MYSTVKEMHIAIDVGLQHINSNRKQSIGIEHKDLALNYAVLQFIETRSNSKTNVKQEGLEDTQKRLDDLRELKRSYNSQTLMGDNRVFSILPVDYYKLLSGGAGIKFSKFDLPKPIGKKTIQVSVFDISDITYDRFNISINDVSVFNIKNYAGLNKLIGEDAKFMLINTILEEVNKVKGIDVHWENWNNEYHKNSLIFVREGRIRNIQIRYANGVIEVNESSRVYNIYDFTSHDYKAIDIVSSQHRFGVDNNYYHVKNKHRNPTGYLVGNRLYIEEGDNFIVANTIIEYIKKPRLINLKNNQTCELTINREIIDLAVQRLKAYIKDEGYQHIVNESQIIE